MVDSCIMWLVDDVVLVLVCVCRCVCVASYAFLYLMGKVSFGMHYGTFWDETHGKKERASFL